MGTELIVNCETGAEETVAYSAPPLPAITFLELREMRDALLARCDFTQLPDAPLTAGQKAEWATYRQALRDLPETVSDLANVVWPEPPAVGL